MKHLESYNRIKKFSNFQDLGKFRYRRLGDVMFNKDKDLEEEIDIIVSLSVTGFECTTISFYKDIHGQIIWNTNDKRLFSNNKIWKLEDFYEEYPHIIEDNIIMINELKNTQFKRRSRWEQLHDVYDNWMKRIPELKVYLDSNKFGL